MSTEQWPTVLGNPVKPKRQEDAEKMIATFIDRKLMVELVRFRGGRIRPYVKTSALMSTALRFT